MSATPEQIADRLEALSKAAFGGDWTVCTEEFGPHKGAVYIHAHDVGADEDGLARDYGKRICDMADNDDDEANAELIAFIGNFARSIARTIRAQLERERVLVEALRSALGWVGHWQRDVDGNLKPTPESLATAYAEIRAALKAAP